MYWLARAKCILIKITWDYYLLLSIVLWFWTFGHFQCVYSYVRHTYACKITMTNFDLCDFYRSKIKWNFQLIWNSTFDLWTINCDKNAFILTHIHCFVISNRFDNFWCELFGKYRQWKKIRLQSHFDWILPCGHRDWKCMCVWHTNWLHCYFFFGTGHNFFVCGNAHYSQKRKQNHVAKCTIIGSRFCFHTRILVLCVCFELFGAGILAAKRRAPDTLNYCSIRSTKKH